MTKNKLRTAASGFSVVEVMVAAGILAIVTLGTTALIVSSQRSESNTQFRSDATELQEEIRALLSHTGACTNSFIGKPTAGTTPITSLYDFSPSPGVVAYTACSTCAYGTGAATTKSLFLSGMSLNNFQAGGGGANSGTMTLNLSMTPTKQGAGAQILYRYININVVVSGGAIQSCLSLSRMEDGIWQVQGTNNNNIYYIPPNSGSLGEVGIGTTAPALLADLKGAGGGSEIDIRSTGRVQLGDSNNTGGIFLDSAGDLFMGQVDGQSTFTVWTDNGGSPMWAFNITQAGFVGLKTTTPLSRLDASAGGVRAAMGDPATLGTGDQSNVGYAFGADGDTGIFKVQNATLATSNIQMGDIAFLDDSAERMRVTNQGRVGIGTTNPGAHLQTYSVTSGAEDNVAYANNSTTANSVMAWTTETGSNNSYMGTQLDELGTGHAVGHFRFGSGVQAARIVTDNDNASAGAIPLEFYQGTAERMRISRSGNVGIGTSSPGYGVDMTSGGLAISGQGGTQFVIQKAATPAFAINVDTAQGTGFTLFDRASGNWHPDITGVDGKVGIGTYSPQTNLDVNGNTHFSGGLTVDGQTTFYGYVQFNGSTSLSDRRLKKDIAELDHGQLDLVRKLVGVYFHWIKPPPEPGGLYEGPKRQIGFIAQDVKKLFPEVVYTNPDGYLSVDYAKLIAPIVEAIKELDAKAEGLAGEVAHLKEQNRDLERRLKVLASKDE